MQEAADFPFAPLGPPPPLADARIREMESRIKWLEGALSTLLQERRPHSTPAEPTVMFPPIEHTQRLVALVDAVHAAQPLNARTVHITPPVAMQTEAEQERALCKTGSFYTFDEILDGPPEVDGDHYPRLFAALQIAPEPPKAATGSVQLDVRAGMEAHPRLLERICAIWRSPECARYLRCLILDERGDRQGFPPEVMSELLLLSSLHELQEVPRGWDLRNMGH